MDGSHGVTTRMIDTRNSFKDVPGYEGRYAVNRMGEVYSYYLDRLMKPKNQRGYREVALLNSIGNKKFFMVHRLVFMTFVGPIPENMEVNHIDGKKSNNWLENLEVVTSSENKLHAFRIGLKSMVGEKHNNLKLNDSAIVDIITSKEMGKVLAEKYGVCRSMVSRIRHGKAWTHITEKHLASN